MIGPHLAPDPPPLSEIPPHCFGALYLNAPPHPALPLRVNLDTGKRADAVQCSGTLLVFSGGAGARAHALWMVEGAERQASACP